jgi:hypothetical protein
MARHLAVTGSLQVKEERTLVFYFGESEGLVIPKLTFAIILCLLFNDTATVTTTAMLLDTWRATSSKSAVAQIHTAIFGRLKFVAHC